MGDPLMVAPFWVAFPPVNDSLAVAGGRGRSGIWSIAGMASLVG